MTQLYPRGSEWRKWDLHVHTPDSVYQNYNGGRDGKDAWESYISDLESLPKEFVILGINDYLFVDGYKRLKEEKEKNGRLKNISMLLPVIEFRIGKFAGSKSNLSRVNFHIIFSPEIEPDIIQQHFLNALPRHYQLSPKGATFKNQWNALATRESLIDLGKKIKASVPKGKLKDYGDDLIEGFNNINFDKDKVIEVLESSHYFKGKYLTAIGKTEWADIKWSDQTIADKKTLINEVDLVFISSECIADYQKSKESLKASNVNDFLLDCSDGHNYSNATVKDRIGKCFTWIKSDPTFEGLKQIIYETDERVKVAEVKPEDKKTYFVIDKIRFVDNTADNLFSSEDIVLNQNLNTIIGGKSTGKSLLLYHIAKAIDENEVSSRVALAPVPDYSGLDQNPLFDFEVVWKDGAKTSLKNPQDIKRKILYIPQNYLSKLSEDCVQTRKALNDFVFNIILQKEDIKTYYFGKKQDIKLCQAEISNLINELFQSKDNILQDQQEIRNMGDEEGIKKYLADLKTKVDELKKTSGLKDAEIENIRKLNDSKSVANEKLISLKKDAQVISVLYDKVLGKLNEINQSISTDQAYLLNEDLKIDITKNFEWIEQYKTKLHTELTTINDKLSKSEKLYEKEIEEVEGKLKPLLEKIKLQQVLKELIDKIKIEEDKLGKIALSKRNLEIKIRHFNELQAQIITSYKKLFGLYKEMQSNLKKGESELADIALNVRVLFKDNEFNRDYIEEYLNKNDLKRLLSVKGDEEFKYEYEEDKHIAVIEQILKGILDNQLNTIKNKNQQVAIQKLFDDYYEIGFFITYKGDTLNKMSPGKRGYVLLKLLVYLSKEEYPILLDQPEGDLDNRSVYYELVSFIKDKKKERQIVIVTHNPNLVVGADAEEIIVANQRGQETDKENKQFRFEYVNGALENTFIDSSENAVLFQKGIREHVCEILEGGEEAFHKREQKYALSSNTS